MSKSNQSVAIVTGASSGIGRISAEALAKAGFTVFGTSRKVVNNGPRGVTMLVTDVTNDGSVKKLIDDVFAKAGRIDLVVNNAGLGLLGAAEESSIAQAKSLFDVNLFGVMRVTNAVLPVMRQQKKGRIINMSSILGMVPAPYNALYSSTKHAIEGYSESLDHEVRTQGIRIVLVEPGATRTAFEDNLTRADLPLREYDIARTKAEKLMREIVETGDAPSVAAAVVVKAALAVSPRRRYTAGKTAKQVHFARRFMPEFLVDKSVRNYSKLPA